MLLHLLVGYIYHQVHHYQKMLPLRPRHPRHDNPIRLKPILSFEDCDELKPKMILNYARKLALCRVQKSTKTGSLQPLKVFTMTYIKLPLRFPYLRHSRLKLFFPYLGLNFFRGTTCTTFAFRSFRLLRDLCLLVEFMSISSPIQLETSVTSTLLTFGHVCSPSKSTPLSLICLMFA